MNGIVWCVQTSTGWCAVRGNERPVSGQLHTVCGAEVDWFLAVRRRPSCPGCGAAVDLTPAQERVLRAAVEACVYRPTGARIATCERIEALGLLRGDRGAGAKRGRAFKPTVLGMRWVEERR